MRGQQDDLKEEGDFGPRDCAFPRARSLLTRESPCQFPGSQRPARRVGAGVSPEL